MHRIDTTVDAKMPPQSQGLQFATRKEPRRSTRDHAQTLMHMIPVIVAVLSMSVVSASARGVCHIPCEPGSPCTDGCDESSCSPRNPLNAEKRNAASPSAAPAPELSSKLMRCEECRVGRWGPMCEPCNCAEDNCDQGIRGLGCADEGGIAVLFGVVAVLLIITGGVLIGRRIIIKKELPTEVATHTVTVVDADSISGSPTRYLRKGPGRIITKGNTGRASVWITKTVESYTSFGVARGAVRNPAFGKRLGKKGSSAPRRSVPAVPPVMTVSGVGESPAAALSTAKLNEPDDENLSPGEDEDGSLSVLVEEEDEEDAGQSHSFDKSASSVTDERPRVQLASPGGLKIGKFPNKAKGCNGNSSAKDGGNADIESRYKIRGKGEEIPGGSVDLVAKHKAVKVERVVKKKHKKKHKHKTSSENGSKNGVVGKRKRKKRKRGIKLPVRSPSVTL